MIDDNYIDEASIDIDAYCVNHDIDDYDLFGEIMVEDNDDDSNIDFDY